MKVRPVDDQKAWDVFVGQMERSQFLQSWAWGEFQSALGREVIRLGVEENGSLVAVALVVRQPLPLGRSYLYLPRGPVVQPGRWSDAWPLLQTEIIERAKRFDALALRIEPPVEVGDPAIDYGKYGFRLVADQQPKVTRLLDLRESVEKLRADLHPKTRYNIGLAERKGVTVREQTNEQGLANFLALQHETARRDRIRPFPDTYFKAMLISLSGRLKIIVAEHENIPLAASLIIQFGDTVTYSHGASADGGRSLMAPHLLQWRVIEEAKSSGFAYYDLRGIAPTDDPRHSWAGITRFKAGFGGRAFRYAGTFDRVLSPAWYGLYRIAQKTLRLTR